MIVSLPRLAALGGSMQLVLIGLVLVVRFLSELVLLATFIAWGAHRDGVEWLLVGIGAAAVVALIWGRWIAPKAPRRLPDPRRYLMEVALFAAGGLAAWTVWSVIPAFAGVLVALVTAWAARSADA